MNSDDQRRGADSIDPDGQISRKLRELYHSVEREPIPQRILKLLEKLDQAERTNASNSDNDNR